MKKLFIILSLGICMPAFPIEQTEVQNKKTKKNDGLKYDAIKGAICLTGFITAGLIHAKLKEQHIARILQDPYFAPYVREKNGKRVLQNSFVPKTVKSQYMARMRNGTGKTGIIIALIGLSSIVATAVYTGKITYKLIKRAGAYMNDKDYEKNEETE